jgi:23S rRNA pseudouridine2605 synthase
LVARQPDEEQLRTWRRGVVLEDGYKTQPAEVRLESTHGKGAWLRIVLKEGRKRQIRETGTLLGLPVVRIIRVRMGSLVLGSLKPKEWRYLSPKEVDELKGKGSALAGPSRRAPSRTSRRSSRPKQLSRGKTGDRSANRAATQQTDKTSRKSKSGRAPDKPSRHPGIKPGKQGPAPSGGRSSGSPRPTPPKTRRPPNKNKGDNH